MYYEGRGVPQDPAKAIRWWRKAADQGLPAAQYNLGLMYENEEGVSQDLAEAAKWYRKAAEQGDDAARQNLAALYDRFPELKTGADVASPTAQIETSSEPLAPGYTPTSKDALAKNRTIGPPSRSSVGSVSNSLASAESTQLFAGSPLSGGDLPNIAGTYRENEIRFKRDFYGKRFSDILPFRDAKESVIFKGTYIIGFGKGGFLSDLDCTVTSQAVIPPLQIAKKATGFA
jgi:hypothetical protein